ncbi:MAG: hypothetical protein IH956_08875 [Chloroflexi bacterium]|nr:hypothetical protein [Chloroflexota bacterium]
MTHPTQGPGDESPSDYSTLLRRYGEAMVRMGELQDEVNRLKRLAGDPAPEPADTTRVGGQGQPGIEDLEKRLSVLERRVSRDARSTTSGTRVDGNPGGDEPDDAGQLRLQLVSLANQLSRAQRELEQAGQEKGRTRRRSRSRSGSGQRRRWWSFWRKRRQP